MKIKKKKCYWSFLPTVNLGCYYFTVGNSKQYVEVYIYVVIFSLWEYKKGIFLIDNIQQTSHSIFILESTEVHL